MASTDKEESILIVGAGIFGVSTAYHLACSCNDPSQVTLIDRTPSPPELAASTDINKIIRADYSSPFYCELAYEALEAWATWPELRPYYHRTGWIMLDEESSDLAERIRKVFRDRSHDPTKDVPLSQLGSQWKGILKGTETGGFRDAYWNPEAGWCEAAAATASLTKAALNRGVRYVNSEVTELLLEDGEFKGVRTADGQRHTADKVVLATGAWTSMLLSPLEDALSISDCDRVEHQAQAAGVSVAHYKMSSAEMEQLSEMPVIVYGAHGEIIPPPTANQLLKFTNANTFTNIITTKTGHKISVPPDRGQHEVEDVLKREMEAAMTSRAMPNYTRGKTADSWRICWDARTPTQDWLLCQHPHPKLNGLYLAVGGSFHSYKFLPNVGKYMVNVLSGRNNGSEKDGAWAWKSGEAGWRGAHEKTAPKRDLKDLEQN